MKNKIAEVVKLDIPPRTFARVLRSLEEKNAVMWEHIEGEKKHAKFYKLHSMFAVDFEELASMVSLGWVENRINAFIQENEKLETPQYIEAIMRLIFSRLNVLAISLMALKGEFSRWMFYQANYQLVEKLLRCILDRAEINEKNKEDSLRQLFELLEDFSNLPSGKFTGLDEMYNSREEVIGRILGAHITR